MNTLKACNYQECYKKQILQGIRFIEKGDEGFPTIFEENEVFMSLGNDRESNIAFVGKTFPSDEEKEIISIYSTEACLNEYAITLRSFFGSDYFAIKGANQADGRVRVLLDMGLSIAIKKYRYILSSILINDGQILSPFEPDELQSNLTMKFCDSLISHIPLIVFFSFSKREYDLAVKALDLGGDIVIHRNALKYREARRLVAEGAPVTDSFTDLLEKCGKTPKGYLYWDKDKNPLFFKV